MAEPYDPPAPVARDSSAGAPRWETIQAWLLSKIAEALGVEPQTLDPRRPLATYGLSSIAAVSLTGELEAYLNIEISPTLVWEHSTIESLAKYLEGEAAADEAVPR